MQMCPYANMLRLFTERGNGHGPRFRGHISGQTSWRQPGSYHGHGIDVLLTEQRLEKQHCTLGKRESGWDGSRETAKCVSSEEGVEMQEVKGGQR